MVLVNSLICLSALVQGGYIVTLKSHDRAGGALRHLEKVQKLFSRERSLGMNKIEHVFESALNGYAAQFSSQVLSKVKAMKEVEAMEVDHVANATALQSNAPWGLARLTSRHKLPYDVQNLAYSHDPQGGNGVDVYLVDTGINVNHREFQGRARWGANFVQGSPNSDETGHGTHCAGIIASKSYGVAKGANVIAIKVFDRNSFGLNSQIIAGIEWAIRNKQGRRGNVLNLSLESMRSDALNSAVRAAKRAGFVVVVAAGNANVDACTVSPASETSVLTVGATNVQDSRAVFSNWGNCLDVFAPGEDILSTWNNGGTSYLSGTSMAAPHVSGIAAVLIQHTNKNTHDQIAQMIKATAEKNVVFNTGNAPNLLATMPNF